MEIMTSLLAILLSMALGAVGNLSYDFLKDPQHYIKRALGREDEPKIESYSERLANLMKSLTKASSEVDNILTELAQVSEDRAKTVQELEAELTKLEEQEKQLEKRIQDLREVPIPVAEHFAAMIAPGERRSAWRDYILFGAGVVVSTVVAILLRLVGLG